MLPPPLEASDPGQGGGGDVQSRQTCGGHQSLYEERTRAHAAWPRGEEAQETQRPCSPLLCPLSGILNSLLLPSLPPSLSINCQYNPLSTHPPCPLSRTMAARGARDYFKRRHSHSQRTNRHTPESSECSNSSKAEQSSVPPNEDSHPRSLKKLANSPRRKHSGRQHNGTRTWWSFYRNLYMPHDGGTSTGGSE
jgi:hypothetical protein